MKVAMLTGDGPRAGSRGKGRRGSRLASLSPAPRCAFLVAAVDRMAETKAGETRDTDPSAQPDAIPSEVLGPNVLSRMNEPLQLARNRIHPGDVWAFEEIVRETRPRQIRRRRWTAMFLGDDVIQVKEKFRDRLRKVTILAAPPAPADQLGF